LRAVVSFHAHQRTDNFIGAENHYALTGLSPPSILTKLLFELRFEPILDTAILDDGPHDGRTRDNGHGSSWLDYIRLSISREPRERYDETRDGDQSLHAHDEPQWKQGEEARLSALV